MGQTQWEVCCSELCQGGTANLPVQCPGSHRCLSPLTLPQSPQDAEQKSTGGKSAHGSLAQTLKGPKQMALR